MKMDMKNWAEIEVEIACKRENPNRKEGEFDYGCACYESALKAFNSLMEDGHSGMSIALTKNILVRLIEGKPLTPIEDTGDIWNFSFEDDKKKSYQCKRMSSLFKYVYPDGTVKYSDNNRYYCVYLDNPDVAWSNGFVRRIFDELYPIEMPYNPPSKSYKVVCEELLTDKKNGDYDTLGILHVVEPDGNKRTINRYFKESSTDCVWDEIDEKEYEDLRLLANKLYDKKGGGINEHDK